jgi:hypothetical protein
MMSEPKDKSDKATKRVADQVLINMLNTPPPPKKPKKHAVLKLPSLKVVGVRMNNDDNPLLRTIPCSTWYKK